VPATQLKVPQPGRVATPDVRATAQQANDERGVLYAFDLIELDDGDLRRLKQAPGFPL
jgi:hypothetical protein